MLVLRGHNLTTSAVAGSILVLSQDRLPLRGCLTVHGLSVVVRTCVFYHGTTLAVHALAHVVIGSRLIACKHCRSVLRLFELWCDHTTLVACFFWDARHIVFHRLSQRLWIVESNRVVSFVLHLAERYSHVILAILLG